MLDYRITHLNAEVTRACNLRCAYCFNDSGLKMPNELGLDEWKKAIDVAQSHGAESALFTGGEVMARKDSPNIIDYALEQRLRTSILSNGHRLNGQYRDLISQLERVQISLDSASPATHDLRRGEEGSWKVAREAIDYARSLDVPVEISTTISADCLDELEGIVGIAYLTDSRVVVRPLQSIGRAAEYGQTDLNKAIEQKQQQLKEKFGNIFVDDFARYVPILGQNHDEIVIPHGYVTVLPDGTIRGTKQNILQLDKAA